MNLKKKDLKKQKRNYIYRVDISLGMILMKHVEIII